MITPPSATLREPAQEASTCTRAAQARWRAGADEEEL